MTARWDAQTPARFREAKPETVDAAISGPWLAHRGNVIVFGSTGTGKTWTAYAMLAAKDTMVRSWLVLSVDAALEFYRNGNERDMRGSRPETCGLLVLDDVGVDRLTEWGSGALDRLVNKRHEHMLPTWVTTNLDPSDGGPLKEYLGNRSWSRLMEDAHIVVMNGADRRLR